MKDSNWEARKKDRADAIFEEFKEFTSGTRTLLLLQRHKEGGETNNSKLKKVITTTPEEFRAELRKLVSEKMDSDLPLRVYSCVNKRDTLKAIRKFRQEQLDAEYGGEGVEIGFYLDLKNRFFGCLMSPQCAKDSLFMFDVDNEEGRDVFGEALEAIPSDKIVKQYRTKNGWHIVTEPFDHTKIQLPRGVELKKDGLLLLDF